MADQDIVEGARNGPRRATVRWDDRAMATCFANVVNAQGTREQIDLFFGTNRTWNIREDSALAVELSNRVMLSPLAAKRLHKLLGNVLAEHEARYGNLDIDQ